MQRVSLWPIPDFLSCKQNVRSHDVGLVMQLRLRAERLAILALTPVLPVATQVLSVPTRVRQGRHQCSLCTGTDMSRYLGHQWDNQSHSQPVVVASP